MWVLSTSGRLRQIDARSGRTVHAVRVPVTTETHLLPAAPGLLTRVSGGRMTAFDPGDGHAVWSARFAGQIDYLAPGRGDTLWVYVLRMPERPDRLVRLVAGSGGRAGQVELRDPGTVGLARVGRELWVAHPNGRITVVR